MKRKQITNPNRLFELVREKKSIWCAWNIKGYRIPAAVIVNWQFYLVMRAINEGVLFEYISKEKKSFKDSLNYPLTPNECYKNIDNDN